MKFRQLLTGGRGGSLGAFLLWGALLQGGEMEQPKSPLRHEEIEDRADQLMQSWKITMSLKLVAYATTTYAIFRTFFQPPASTVIDIQHRVATLEGKVAGPEPVDKYKLGAVLALLWYVLKEHVVKPAVSNVLSPMIRPIARLVSDETMVLSTSCWFIQSQVIDASVVYVPLNQDLVIFYEEVRLFEALLDRMKHMLEAETTYQSSALSTYLEQMRCSFERMLGHVCYMEKKITDFEHELLQSAEVIMHGELSGAYSRLDGAVRPLLSDELCDQRHRETLLAAVEQLRKDARASLSALLFISAYRIGVVSTERWYAYMLNTFGVSFAAP